MDTKEIKLEASLPIVQCFLCGNGNSCAKMIYQGQGETVEDKATAFKMLLRYLNIDILKISRFTTTSSEVIDGVAFCDKCGILVGEFWEWYKNLEAVRLCLTNCLQAVSKNLRKNEDTLLEKKFESNSSEGLYGLRKAVILKCQNKFVSQPRITLPKVTVPNTIIEEEPSLPLESLQLSQSIPLEEDITEFTPSSLNCIFCEETFDSTFNLQRHSLLHHAFLMLISRLPPGTTEVQLEQAIKSTVDLHLGEESAWGCVSCKIPISSRDLLKTHILESHWDHVMSALDEEKETWNISKETLQAIKIPFTAVTDDIEKKKLSSSQICEKRFENLIESQVASLNMTMTSPSRLYKCSNCVLSFGTNDTLSNHCKVSHTAKFLGSLIPCKFSDAELSTFILKSSRSLSPLHRECRFCKRIVRWNQVKLHILNNHLDNIVKELCP